MRKAGRAAVERIDEDHAIIGPLVRQMLDAIGEDPNRDGLSRTPDRVERSLRFLTAGYGQDVRAVVGSGLFGAPSGDVVIVRDVEFFSLCEHHLLPFFGRVHVAYIPRDLIIGLSKIPRIVDVFARRLQVQERLTIQVRDALQQVLNPLGVAVVCEAQHCCVMMRGVEKQHTSTVTVSTAGRFALPRNHSKLMMLMNPRVDHLSVVLDGHA